MDREIAEAIVAKLQEMATSLNELADIIETIPDDTEKKAYRRRWASAVANNCFDLEMDIFEQYPDLDPY